MREGPDPSSRRQTRFMPRNTSACFSTGSLWSMKGAASSSTSRNSSPRPRWRMRLLSTMKAVTAGAEGAEGLMGVCC